MAVCGSGGAGKEQVQRMVGTLLGSARAADSRPCRRRARGRDLPRRQRRLAARSSRRSIAVPPAASRRRLARMIAAVRGEVMVRRADHVVIDAGGVGYRLAVSAETLKAVPGDRPRGLPARRADRPRRLARSLRLCLRGGARPLPRADLGQRNRPQGRDRDALRRRRHASCCGRSRPATPNASRRSPGSASGPRSGSSSSCARRSPAHSRRRSSPPARAADAARAGPRRPGQPWLRAAGGRAAA